MTSLQSSNSPSYSTVSKTTTSANEKVPSREQAIVFPVLQNLTNEDYVDSLCELVPPEKLRFVFRMANNRLCIYFDTKETADQFMESHGEIKINNQLIKARYLINLVHKLLLSNVCPAIPNSILVNYLSNTIGLKLSSQMSYVKAGLSKSKYSHINSSRRFVLFSNEDDNLVIPEYFVIKYCELEFRIFLSTDTNMKCYHCKKMGHTAKKCPSVNKHDNHPPNSVAQENINLDFPPVTPPPVTPENIEKGSMEGFPQLNPPQKRSLSESPKNVDLNDHQEVHTVKPKKNKN